MRIHVVREREDAYQENEEREREREVLICEDRRRSAIGDATKCKNKGGVSVSMGYRHHTKTRGARTLGPKLRSMI